MEELGCGGAGKGSFRGKRMGLNPEVWYAVWKDGSKRRQAMFHSMRVSSLTRGRVAKPGFANRRNFVVLDVL
ncbi:hypothetical protein N7475_001566 [Penicillium sp. IBT 31633x]|nr:hypothetical protein N7475_001566 [Penicillium sp. IBT 31633x]